MTGLLGALVGTAADILIAPFLTWFTKSSPPCQVALLTTCHARIPDIQLFMQLLETLLGQEAMKPANKAAEAGIRRSSGVLIESQNAMKLEIPAAYDTLVDSARADAAATLTFLMTSKGSSDRRSPYEVSDHDVSQWVNLSLAGTSRGLSIDEARPEVNFDFLGTTTLPTTTRDCKTSPRETDEECWETLDTE